MILEPINQNTHPLLTSIKPLYEDAFPEYERREWEKLINLLPIKELHLLAIIEDEQFIGFVIYWILMESLYIEHFAIAKEQRGKHYGKNFLKYLSKEISSKMVLEAELPLTNEAVRRVIFYERCGFKVIPFDYFQPPYKKDGTAMPMKLLSNYEMNKSSFNEMAETIRVNVYERFY